ncbi:MAG: DUF1883 domain-containing protein [Bacteroidota bacterium]
MRYLHSVHKVRKGQSIEVTFDKPAKIMLISDRQFKRYTKSISFRYRGGFLQESPFNFPAPADGKWHIVVELGGYFNYEQVQATARVVTPERHVAQEQHYEEEDAGDVEEAAEEHHEEEAVPAETVASDGQEDYQEDEEDR